MSLKKTLKGKIPKTAMKSSSLSKKSSTIDRDGRVGRVGNVQLLALGTNPWGFSDGVSELNDTCKGFLDERRIE